MMTTQSITSKDKKGLHAISLFEGAYNNAMLDEDQAQRLNENEGGAFTNELLGLIQKHSATNQYAGEIASSNYTYPKEYRGPKEITEQINLLGKIFGLDTKKALENAKKLPALPNDAEGWFAIPRMEVIGAKFFPKVTDPVERYCEGVNLVLDKIAKSRKFTNYRAGEIDKQHLRGHARTIAKFGEVKQQQPEGDILIIAAQLGMRHRGKSVRRARETFASNEFGLGAFAVCCIALTHPERLVRWEELDMDCAGDEFSPDADGAFSRAPVLFFDDGRVRFGTRDVSDAYDRYGSASGFVPPVAS